MAIFSDILIARQPILKRNQTLYGYEILYRTASHRAHANIIDGDEATTQVIINSFADLGLSTIVGEAKAFINLTRNYILGKNPIPIPPNNVVFEILEDIPIDTELIDAIKCWRNQGYSFALDDVVSIKKISPILRYVHYAKVYLMNIHRSKLPTIVSTLLANKVIPLAEKIETQKDFQFCSNLGFKLFQGYFFSKPNIVEGKRLESTRLVLLRSLASLQDPKVDYAYLERIIAQDASLGYKLLRLINSAQYSMAVEVKSLRQAISLIGVTHLRGWMSLLLMASLENKPHELTILALTRARMAELLSIHIGDKRPGQYFIVGLFSVLDALMDMPMEQVLDYLPLDKEIIQALLQQKGKMGIVLKLIIAHEHGDMHEVFDLNIQPEIFNKVFRETMLWTNALQKGIYS
jgi:EAL and modified HD-GYP domain-containing signal transduction protein